MLYSLIHNLPLWTDKPESIRNIYTFALTTTIYVFAVVILQSGALDNTKYGNFLKNNIYSIWAIDSIYLGISYYYENNHAEEDKQESNNEFQNKVKTELDRLHKQRNMAEEKKRIESQMRKKIFNKHGHVFSESVQKKEETQNKKPKNIPEKLKPVPEQNKMTIKEKVEEHKIEPKKESEKESEKQEDDIQIYNEEAKTENEQSGIIEVNEESNNDEEDDEILVYDEENKETDKKENDGNKINNLENQIDEEESSSNENTENNNNDGILSESNDNLPVFKST